MAERAFLDMPSLRKAKNRDRKRKKARHGMRITNRGIFTLEEIKYKKAQKIKSEERKKRKKEVKDE